MNEFSTAVQLFSLGNNNTNMNDPQSRKVLSYSEIEPFLKRQSEQDSQQRFQEMIIRKARENNVPIYEKKRSPSDGDQYSDHSGSIRNSINSNNRQLAKLKSGSITKSHHQIQKHSKDSPAAILP